MIGARTGSFAGALVGFFAGIAAYNIASGKIYEMLNSVPDSTDRAYFGYDDFFISYP